MDVLVDTEVLLWVQAGDPRLSKQAISLILSPTHYKWVSHTSLLEIAIKFRIGKLPQIGLSLPDFFKQIQQDGFKLLPISKEHILSYQQLPLFDEHRDPFDRLILSTALYEKWPLLSADSKFGWYKDLVEMIW